MENKFIVYAGVRDRVLVRDRRLSQVYRLQKGKGLKIENQEDLAVLEGYKERVQGCCGKPASEKKVIYMDEEWCKWQGLDLKRMREYWESTQEH